jgi:hypothetical protein
MSGETKVVAVEADGLTASLVVEPSKKSAYVALYTGGNMPDVALIASRNESPSLQVNMGDGTFKFIDLRKLAKHLEQCDASE